MVDYVSALPSCAGSRCVVLVADDSDGDVPLQPGVALYRLSPGAGGAAARNELVREAHRGGSGFVFMSGDGDVYRADSFDLDRLRQALQHTAADLVAVPGSQGARGAGSLVVHDHELYVIPYYTRFGERWRDCFRVDFVQSRFLAPTATVLDGWDPALKDQSHYDFMLAMRAQDARMWVCSQQSAVRDGESCPEDEDVDQFKHTLVKWGLRTIYDGQGRRIGRDGVAPTKSIVRVGAPVANRKQESTAFADSALGADAIAALNSCLPGWFRNTVLLWTRAQQTHINSCVSEVSVAAEVTYERPLSEPQPEDKVKFTFLAVDPLCPIRHEFLRKERTLVVPARPVVYFVASVRNCIAYVKRLVRAVKRERLAGHDVSLVLADFQSSDASVRDEVKAIDKRAQVLTLEGEFSRSRGLDAAVRFVQSIEHRQGRHVRVFAVDTSVVIPPGFTRHVVRYVHHGLSVYAPIVRKILLADLPSHEAALEPSEELVSRAKWVHAGYGMLGFTLTDYERAGGYDAKRYGARWGHEDVDMVARMQALDMLVVRSKSELVHSEYKTPAMLAYRSKPNPVHTLPVVPESLPVRQVTTFLEAMKKVAPELRDPGVVIQSTMGQLIKQPSGRYSQVVPKQWFVFVIYSEGEATGEEKVLVLGDRAVSTIPNCLTDVQYERSQGDLDWPYR